MPRMDMPRMDMPRMDMPNMDTMRVPPGAPSGEGRVRDMSDGPSAGPSAAVPVASIAASGQRVGGQGGAGRDGSSGRNSASSIGEAACGEVGYGGGRERGPPSDDWGSHAFIAHRGAEAAGTEAIPPPLQPGKAAPNGQTSVAASAAATAANLIGSIPVLGSLLHNNPLLRKMQANRPAQPVEATAQSPPSVGTPPHTPPRGQQSKRNASSSASSGSAPSAQQQPSAGTMAAALFAEPRGSSAATTHDAETTRAANMAAALFASVDG
mmetsp:Transcript_61276/g.136460  ORF Transcript_61276/g.136460 Transcript_61276/m.136460 type:complete len:267 (-) Transcript_61276:242-1042(-)